MHEIAALLGKPGAYALNSSYEWCCTSGVGVDPEAAFAFYRVLDWRRRGWAAIWWWLGSAAPQRFANITWLAMSVYDTALAAGSICGGDYQPPIASSVLSLPIEWVMRRIAVWRPCIAPSHLLRAKSSRPAKLRCESALLETPLCMPASSYWPESSPAKVALSSGPQIGEHCARCRRCMPTIGSRCRGAATIIAQLRASRAVEATLSVPLPGKNTPYQSGDSACRGNVSSERRMILQGWERSGRPGQLFLDINNPLEL